MYRPCTFRARNGQITIANCTFGGIGQASTHREIDDGALSKSVATLTTAPVAVLNRSIDGLGGILRAVTFGAVLGDVAKEVVVAPSNGLLAKSSKLREPVPGISHGKTRTLPLLVGDVAAKLYHSLVVHGSKGSLSAALSLGHEALEAARLRPGGSVLRPWIVSAVV